MSSKRGFWAARIERYGRKSIGILWEKQGAIAIATIDNPPVKVLTDEVRDEIAECMQQIRGDDGVVSAVITGSGEKAFVAGTNIRGFPAMTRTPGVAYG